MSQVITLGNSRLAPGVRGILKPMDDGSGYTRVNAGGFNLPNRAGIKYPFNKYLQEQMGEGSDLNRRVNDRQVFCELGHPDAFFYERVNGVVVRTAITEPFQWVMRLRTILQERVCAHIRKIHWTMTGGVMDPVLNDVELIPFGPYKEWVEDALANPDINFALSLRSVTMPQQMGDVIREVEYLSTYDVVVESGIPRATKYNTAGLEEYLSSQVMSAPMEMTTTVDELIYVCEKTRQDTSIMDAYEGTESSKQLDSVIKMLKGMRHTKPITLVRSNSLGVFG